MKQQTRIVARAVITKGDQVLLCYMKKSQHYFFPGGGVEFQEGAVNTLRREMQEELGANMLTAKFIGFVENHFTDGETLCDEPNLVFAVTIDTDNPISKEDHISFSWIKINDIAKENILPVTLKLAVAEWLNNGQMFWVGK